MDESRTSQSLVNEQNHNSRDIHSTCKEHKLNCKSMYSRDQTTNHSNPNPSTSNDDHNRLYGPSDIDRPFLFDQNQSFDDLLLISQTHCTNSKPVQHKFFGSTKSSPEIMGPIVGGVRPNMSYDWNKSNHIQQNIPYRIVMKNNQIPAFSDSRLFPQNKNIAYTSGLSNSIVPNNNLSNTTSTITTASSAATNSGNTSLHQQHPPITPTTLNNYANGTYSRSHKPLLYSSAESYFDRPKTQRFAQWQIDILESYFKKSFYVSKEEKIKISEETGLSVRQISVWFQNRRAKKKR